MFTSDIRHKEGKALVIPDWLSRPAGCPVGRAYEVETTTDFENDKFQFKVPDVVKGRIKVESIQKNATSSGEKEHSVAHPSEGDIQAFAPSVNEIVKSRNVTLATPSGKNSATVAPSVEASGTSIEETSFALRKLSCWGLPCIVKCLTPTIPDLYCLPVRGVWLLTFCTMGTTPILKRPFGE